MSILLENLGKRVREARSANGWTLKALAERSSVSRRYLAELENGRGNISIARLECIAEALHLPIIALLAPKSMRSPLATLMALDDSSLARLDGKIAQWLTEEPFLRKRIFALLGVRGAGKSTVGSLAAQRMGLEFVELDAWIEDAAGMKLTELFAMHGEAYYRRLEREALQRFLDRGQPAVLATGGSLVTHSDTWSLLKRSATTAWLRARPEDLWSRVLAQGDHRPMEQHPQAFAQLEALLESREPLYRQAHYHVETTGRSITELVDEIVQVASDIPVDAG